MAKIIVFSNQKGGTGKSTLCVQYANYLASQGKGVAVLDADLQQSIIHLRQREMATNPDFQLPWGVWSATSNTRAFMEKAASMDGYVLVDCPGTLNDTNLLPVFKAATAIIIPFRYDDLIVDSTIMFVKVLRKNAINAKVFFQPNMIDARVKIQSEEHIKTILREAGYILPRIKQGVAVQRASTLTQDNYQQLAVMHAVEEFVLNID